MPLSGTGSAGSEEQLLQSQRLVVIGEMAAMIAHEIRNPLAGMSLCLRLLRDHEDDAATRRMCYDDLAEGIRRINDTVTRALDFSKARPPSPSRCSVARMIAHAQELAATSLRKSGVELHTELPDDLPPITADSVHLEQLFVNLILNACKAMPNGGRVTVRARAEGGMLHAEVADTGVGIAPDHAERIFDPFTSHFAVGAGLGLALCRRIVNAHGGTLHVESHPGTGSTFRIALPLEPPDASRAAD